MNISRLGYKGSLNKKIQAFLNSQFGTSYRTGYFSGSRCYTKTEALQLYEDAYYHYFNTNREVVNWLVSTASDVYDTAETNIQSKEDYSIQETPSTHYQDIAIRRAVRRLGLHFSGDRLVKVRSPESEGYRLNPGSVPFHRPDRILKPSRKGWWEPDSIEDFWQSNKILQRDSNAIEKNEGRWNNDRFPVDDDTVRQEGGLQALRLLFCSYQTPEPTIFGVGEWFGAMENRFYVGIELSHPYDRLIYRSMRTFYHHLSDNFTGIDLLIRICEQLPRNTMKKIRKFAKTVHYIS